MISCTAHAATAPGWIEPLRVIYDHELVLFGKGQFVVEISDVAYPCPADSFIIVPPGRWHASWETGGKPGHRYWSHFDWIHQGPHGDSPIMTFHPACPRAAACHRAPRFVPRRILHGPIPSPQRAYELAERLSALQVQGSEHDRAVSRALLLELLLELLDTRSRGTANAAGQHNLSHRVRDLLEQNLFEHGHLRIQDLMAKNLGYSYAHLCRVFRARYGIPPLKYLNALCISRARLLLRDTDVPVSAIACRLGFRDPLYFSQLFRRATGQSPSQYRKAGRHKGHASASAGLTSYVTPGSVEKRK